MRLAKGFFLPLIAVEMRSQFCRLASGGRRPQVLWDAFCERRRRKEAKEEAKEEKEEEDEEERPAG